MVTVFNKNNMKRRLKKWRKSWKIFSSNWMGMIGLVLLLFIVILAILGPSITPYGPQQRNPQPDPIPYPPFSDELPNTHILGTDSFGRDVFTILLDSLRISLLVGIVAGSLTVIVGTTIGVASAYLGGWVDNLIMRIADVVLVLPALPVMLLLASVIPLIVDKLPFLERVPQWQIIAFVYIVVFWPVSAKLIRGQALSLKQRAFVTSAKSAGANNWYVIRKHLLPNVFPLMLTMIITSMRQAILYEAFLAYLGLADPIIWSLGKMLEVAQNQFALATGAWWLFFPPGFAIAITTLSFAFIGIAFDEIVNPRLRKDIAKVKKQRRLGSLFAKDIDKDSTKDSAKDSAEEGK